jgi:chloramphenicol 3-O-phosphotransferase
LAEFIGIRPVFGVIIGEYGAQHYWIVLRMGLMMNRYIIISGLPASGKSTVARAVAHELALPVLDKDALLESLFERLGIGDARWRRRLSRAADQDFRDQAEQSKGAVLASWWKHPLSPDDSGTPTEWLASLPGLLVEVHCNCSPAIAARRFVMRKRHPGHLDDRWSYVDLLASFSQQTLLGPLRIGCVVDVQTENEFELGALMSDIAQAFEEAPSRQEEL